MGIESMTVLVTGAASGIGHALSMGFLDDGARVVAVDINQEGLEPLAEKGAVTRIVDVTDPDQVDGMVQAAVDETGRLDVLINNAGVTGISTVENLQPDQFEHTIRVNLFGPVYGMRAAIPVMRSQGFGRIINLVSRMAEMGISLSAAYGSSKAALLSVTRCAAMEVVDTDILINGMIPGPTKSGMMPKGQDPSVVYPHARTLATLPAGGPTGKVFWNSEEYHFFYKDNETAGLFIRDPETQLMKPYDPGTDHGAI
jgi:NAD(P)-dependent dehydrogenase (short-subunit alcohol dehydrogenase family)